MNSKAKVSIILAVIGLLGGGGALIAVDMSTNISTIIGDTIINEAMDNEQLREIGTDIAINLICSRVPEDPICN